MFCEKCGNQITDGAAFCERCGNQIKNSDLIINNKPPLRISMKMIGIITIAVFLIITAIVIPVSISSCKGNKSLADMLTAHTWVSYYHNEPSRYLTFNSNGTYTSRSATSSNVENGSWNITNNQLKMGKNSYDYWENLSDTDIDRDLTGRKYYSWYVSDNYLVYCEDCVYGEDQTQIYTAE